MVWSFTHPLGHARPSVRLSRDPFAPVGTSLGTALYIPCVLQPLQRPLQRGNSPFSQMRKQVQRGQAQGHSLSKWPIQNSSEVWLRSTFMAPVSLGPPAGVGWNSKGSWGCEGSPGTRYLLCWLCPDNSAFLSFPAQHSLGATFGSEWTSRLFTHFPCYRRPSNPAASLRPCDLGQVPVLLRPQFPPL